MRDPWKVLAQCLAHSRDSRNFTVVMVPFLLPISCQSERAPRKRSWSRNRIPRKPLTEAQWQSFDICLNFSICEIWKWYLLYIHNTGHIQQVRLMQILLFRKVESAVCGCWVVIASQRQSPSLFSEVRVGRIYGRLPLNRNAPVLFQLQFNIFVDFHSEISVKSDV